MRKSGFKVKGIAFLRPSYRRFPFLLLLAYSGLASINSFGQGNLLISPRRIVFEGDKKTQELNLANTGKDTSTYLISMMEIRMTEEGAFVEITEPDPGQNFASKYLRFFPRTVTLAPNEAQTVKIQLTKTSALAPGEYRSHIYFRAVPKPVALGDDVGASTDSNITVKLTPVFGITIPAIIRIGESNTQVSLSNIAFDVVGDTMPRISLALNRTGNMSAYGDIAVTHVSDNGKITPVGTARGVAIYSPNLIRRFNFDLDRTTSVNFKKGKLHVEYITAEDRGKGVVKPMAEADLQL
jgi:hypothetical protein